MQSQPEENIIEARTDESVSTGHKQDSLNILIYCILLILTVLTVWLLKQHRLRYLHESGLSVVYGLIVGVIIRYGTARQRDEIGNVALPSANFTIPPKFLDLRLCEDSCGMKNCTEENRMFRYALKGPRQLEGNGSKVPLEDLELDKATFDPEIFFNVILPPIIFYAGYIMKRRHFFRNIGAILTFAFVGTTISCFVVGLLVYGLTRPVSGLAGKLEFTDCLFFGALISATDPVTILAIFHDLHVDVDLYALVFGESVLNDAVAIVLTGAIESYSRTATLTTGFNWGALFSAVGNFIGIFAGSFSIGCVLGCLTALLTKYTNVKEYPVLETTLFVLMSYTTFLLAETFELSGIVAVLFCGICQAHYTYNNLSSDSKMRTRQLFELLNFMAENFVFLYIGVSVFTYRRHLWDLWFILASFLGIAVGRACNIYPLSLCLNLARKNKIRYNMQHMMVFSGLRGAIAFALAIRNTSTPTRQLIFSTTLLVVITTILFLGGLTMPMLQWLRISVGSDDETLELQPQVSNGGTSQSGDSRYQSMSSPNHQAITQSQQSSSSMQVPGEMVIQPIASGSSPREKAWLVLKWYNLDQKIIKPLLTHSTPLLSETLPQWGCCQWLASCLTTDEQLQHMGVSHRGVGSSEESDEDLILASQEVIVSPSGTIPIPPFPVISSKNTAEKSRSISAPADVPVVSGGPHPLQRSPAHSPAQEDAPVLGDLGTGHPLGFTQTRIVSDTEKGFPGHPL